MYYICLLLFSFKDHHQIFVFFSKTNLEYIIFKYLKLLLLLYIFFQASIMTINFLGILYLIFKTYFMKIFSHNILLFNDINQNNISTCPFLYF